MTPTQVAHQIVSLLVFHIPEEHRQQVINYVQSSFNGDGKAIAHSFDQELLLQLLDDEDETNVNNH